MEAASREVHELLDIDLSEVQAAVGPGAFKRGRAYARAERVLALDWDLETGALTGTVVGNGAVYNTTAYFAEGPDRQQVFDGGECTCPVGYDCKHVAAIMIAAADRRGDGPPVRLAGPRGEGAAGADMEPWEQPLRALIRRRPASRWRSSFGCT